jgi:NADH-quinone oxidoreductase subunit E
MEYVADMLGMAYIRVLEVATFYFMFQLQPVGSVAHIQICGTTSCMICGAEELIAVCHELISKTPHTLSADGKFSWEEVECMGACANAPMAQIGKDYYEDLTAEKLRALIGRFLKGEVPVPGPQNGRYAAEPLSGLTTLKEFESGKKQYNASAQLAVDIRDTVKKIDGTEVPLKTPWLGVPAGTRAKAAVKDAAETVAAKAAEGVVKAEKAVKAGAEKAEKAVKAGAEKAVKAVAEVKAKVAEKVAKASAQTSKADEPVAAGLMAAPAAGGTQPKGLKAPKKGKADDLQIIEGIGPVLEKLCHELGIFHFDQIAGWGEAEIAWMDGNLKGFRGRVTRDKWVAQAKLIGEVGIEEFLIRAKTNNY